jgi:hypothetical protein
VPCLPPPRDIEGKVIAHDNEKIRPEHLIIRRIADDYLVPDEKAPNGRRVSSGAYSPSSDGNRSMSIDIEFLIIEAGKDAHEYVDTPQFIGSVYFVADFLRREQLLVGWDPRDENPYHGGVWGGFSKSQRRRLGREAQWYNAIEGVDLF